MTIARTIEFVRSVGLDVRVAKGPIRGFIRHVRIEQGVLLIDDKCAASALLHEAGHLAIIPGDFRHLASSNVSKAIRVGFEAANAAGLDAIPDEPMICAMMQTSDPEATAWAFAAGRAIGVPDDQIILDREYGGDGRMQRVMLAGGHHLGIHGLQHAGMCRVRQYPEMIRWLQPVFHPELFGSLVEKTKNPERTRGFEFPTDSWGSAARA